MESLPSPEKPIRPPVKLACLACRSQRVRCDGLETCERCLRTGKQCIYAQSRRGRRLKRSTFDSIRPLRPDWAAPEATAAFSNVNTQLDLDADLCPDLLMDDNDAVFDSLLFNPSYPFSASLDFLVGGENLQNPGVLRQYQCDHDIMDAYYVWIHPTFPALPDPKYSPVDRPMEWLPATFDELPIHSPSNPLILAILAIVVMIPMPGKAETNTSAVRRQFSSAISGRAYENIAIEAQSSQDGSGFVRNPTHPLVTRDIESTLALCLLGQYEYLQNGNMEKMQRFTREAVETALRLQLHLQPCSNQSKFEDARRRAWWTVYLCVCNVTIVSCVPPIMPLKDAMYTAAYPESGDWKIRVGAERILVLATLFLKNLILEFGNPAEMELIRKSMQVLNGEISRSLTELKASGSPGPMSFHRKVALARLHGARIKVHRYCALLEDDNAPTGANTDRPLAESTLAATASSGNVVPPSSASTTDPLAASRSSGGYFPFSSTLSMRYCLESAGVILRTLPEVSQVHMAGTNSKLYTFTPFACSIMLAGYTFLMLRHKTESYEASVEAEPGSRGLTSECERGAASCMEVLDGFSQVWMHLEDAAMHMKEAAKYL